MDWYKRFREKYSRETDPKVNAVNMRDYYNVTVYIGFYADLSKPNFNRAIAQFVITLIMLAFHFVLLIRTTFLMFTIDFTVGVFNLQISLLVLFTMLVIVMMVVNRRVYEIVHNEMAYEIFKYEVDQKEIIGRIVKEMSDEKRKVVLLPIFLCFTAASIVSIGPILDDKYGTIEVNITDPTGGLGLVVPLYGYPFPVNNFIAKSIANILILVTAVCVVVMIGSASYILLNLSQHYVLHVQLLAYNIGNTYLRGKAMFKRFYGESKHKTFLYDDKRFMKCYEECLQRSLFHHQKLIQWASALQVLVSAPIGISYFTGSLVIGLNLIAISTGTKLPGTFMTSIMCCLSEIGFMALISILGQRITDKTEEISMRLYNTEWYHCNKQIKSDIKIFQEMTKRPIVLSGMGMVPANLNTFSNVMNSAYSYYNLITAFN